jgi:hypothetical protein
MEVLLNLLKSSVVRDYCTLCLTYGILSDTDDLPQKTAQPSSLLQSPLKISSQKGNTPKWVTADSQLDNIYSCIKSISDWNCHVPIFNTMKLVVFTLADIVCVSFKIGNVVLFKEDKLKNKPSKDDPTYTQTILSIVDTAVNILIQCRSFLIPMFCIPQYFISLSELIFFPLKKCSSESDGDVWSHLYNSIQNLFTTLFDSPSSSLQSSASYVKYQSLFLLLFIISKSYLYIFLLAFSSSPQIRQLGISLLLSFSRCSLYPIENIRQLPLFEENVKSIIIKKIIDKNTEKKEINYEEAEVELMDQLSEGGAFDKGVNYKQLPRRPTPSNTNQTLSVTGRIVLEILNETFGFKKSRIKNKKNEMQKTEKKRGKINSKICTNDEKIDGHLIIQLFISQIIHPHSQVQDLLIRFFDIDNTRKILIEKIIIKSMIIHTFCRLSH